jgi:predicted AAA+ superfamily ATPase
VQQVNPKKWYSIDSGLITVNSRSFTPDYGRLLETVVFLHLRRKYTTIFYFSEKRECDFVVFQNMAIQHILQVSFEINSINKQREIEGLVEAMNFFQQNKAYIVTFDQEDELIIDDKKVILIPFWKWVVDIL